MINYLFKLCSFRDVGLRKPLSPLSPLSYSLITSINKALYALTSQIKPFFTSFEK